MLDEIWHWNHGSSKIDRSQNQMARLENQRKKEKESKRIDYMGLKVTPEIRRRIELVQKNNPNLSVAIDRLVVGGFSLVNCSHSNYLGKAKRRGSYLLFLFREDTKTDEKIEFVVDLSQRMNLEIKSEIECIRDSEGVPIVDYEQIDSETKKFDIWASDKPSLDGNTYFYKMTRYVELRIEYGENTTDFPIDRMKDFSLKLRKSINQT